MVDVDMKELQRHVELTLSCGARYVESVPVKEEFEGAIGWDGIVQVFELEDYKFDFKHLGGPGVYAGIYPITHAYGWSAPIEGSGNMMFYVVVQHPPIFTPRDAVKAAVVQQHRQSQQDS